MDEPDCRFLVLNLDDTLTWQGRLLALPHVWVDLTHLEGKKSCATRAALEAIQAALLPYRHLPICFWGAGEYHYAALVRLRILRQPMTLVLFDHHPDLAPTQDGVVTCGDWVRHALELPWIQRVVWVGGREPERWGFQPHPKVVRVARTSPPEHFARWASRLIPGGTVYISIDKDVLAPGDVQTTWGSGDMPLADLLAWIRLLGRCRTVVGADVGGEWALPPGQLVPRLQDRGAIHLNQQANLAIRSALNAALREGRAAVHGKTG